eukprot:6463040-Pyramimonas_sp.AAC.1
MADAEYAPEMARSPGDSIATTVRNSAGGAAEIGDIPRATDSQEVVNPSAAVSCFSSRVVGARESVTDSGPGRSRLK